jgi:hypothetical protein
MGKYRTHKERDGRGVERAWYLRVQYVVQEGLCAVPIAHNPFFNRTQDFALLLGRFLGAVFAPLAGPFGAVPRGTLPEACCISWDAWQGQAGVSAWLIHEVQCCSGDLEGKYRSILYADTRPKYNMSQIPVPRSYNIWRKNISRPRLVYHPHGQDGRSGPWLRARHEVLVWVGNMFRNLAGEIGKLQILVLWSLFLSRVLKQWVPFSVHEVQACSIPQQRSVKG